MAHISTTLNGDCHNRSVAPSVTLTLLPGPAVRAFAVDALDAKEFSIWLGGVRLGRRTNMAYKPHRGSTLDTFLEEEGVPAETRAKAIEEVIAWRRANPARKTRRFSKGG